MTELATNELARARAARIRAGIQTYLHTLADIAAAYAQQDWKALGYQDWQGYIDGEYSEHRLKLTPEHRRKAVEELRLAGMSQRAIGTALGVSKNTVTSDLSQIGTPEEITGTDGKTYAASRPSQPARPPVEADAQLDRAPAQDGARDEADAVPAADAGDGAGDAYGAPAPQTATETPGASVSVDADGEGPTTGPVVVDAAGDPTAHPSAGSPVNPLDDPKRKEADRRERVSERVAAGLVHLHEALNPDPIEWLTEWVPGAYKNRGIQHVEDILTPAGLRSIAQHLDTLADYLDKTDGAL